MEGRPGSGKTTLLKHWAIQWAEYIEHLERDEPCDGNQGTSTLSDIDLLVYINRDHEGSCLEETIQNAMKGPPREKQEAAQFWKEHPDKVFLFIDALDEFKNKEVVGEVFRLASDQSTNLLVSCRDGHQYLNNQMKNFTRHLKVASFTQTGTKKLIGKYMNVLCEEKANDLCFHINEAKHSHIYTSPMNCVFVCQLYSEERLTSEDLVNLTLPKLYMLIEDLLLEREYKKFTEKKRLEGGKEENEEMKEKIYKMALRSLGVGESSYTTNQLEEFGIDVNSPAMVLLQKYNHTSTSGEVEVYCWPHKSVREYHAAKAIRGREMMYFIASKQDLLGVTHFLLPMLAETDMESATHLLNASLFLQAEHLPNCKESLCSRLFGFNHCSKIQALKTEIHGLELDELLDGKLTLYNSLNIEAIQNCISNSNWLWDNLINVAFLCSCLEYIQSQEILLHFMKTVFFPFFPFKVPFEKAKSSLLFLEEFFVKALQAFLYNEVSKESKNDDDNNDDNGQCLGEYDLTDALDRLKEIVYQARNASDRIEDDSYEDATDDSFEIEDVTDESYEIEDAMDETYIRNAFHKIKYILHRLGKLILLSNIKFYLHLINVRKTPCVFGMTFPNITELMNLVLDTDQCISTGGQNLILICPSEIGFDDFTRNNLNNLAESVGHINYLILGMFQVEDTEGKLPVETILELNETFKPVGGVKFLNGAKVIAGHPESIKKILKLMGVNILTTL